MLQKLKPMRKILLSIIILISFINLSLAQEIINDGELNGVIEVGKGKHKRQLDYNFKVTYSKDTCENNEERTFLEFYKDDDSSEFIAPKTAKNENFLQFLAKEIHYPKYAVDNGLEGKVYVHFEITKTGEVKNIWITKGVNISLDKETERIIRKLKFTTPPLLKGKPVDFCIDFPIVFQFG